MLSNKLVACTFGLLTMFPMADPNRSSISGLLSRDFVRSKNVREH